MEGNKIFDELSETAKRKAEKHDRLQPIGIKEILLTEFPENEWVVEKLIPKNGTSIISGYPGSFKTWVTMQIAIAVAKGEKLFSVFACSQAPVLIIDEENNIREIQKRLMILGANADLPIDILYQKNFKVNDKADLEAVLEICKAKKIGLVIMDSLVRIHDNDENDARQMSEVFGCIKEFCKLNITVFITHHERKEAAFQSHLRMRGSSDIYASLESHLSIKLAKDREGKLTIEQTKLRCAKEIKPFELLVKEADDIISFEYVGEIQQQNKGEDIEAAIVLLLSETEQLSKQEIVERLNKEEGFGEKAIRKSLGCLIEKGEIEERKGDKNTKLCSLPGKNFTDTEIELKAETAKDESEWINL
jgi:RecA-family ATPase